MPLPLVLVTHPRERLATYFGEQALANLQGLARVKLNPDANDWSTPELIEAAQGCDVLIAYRQTALPAEFFTAVPSLLAAVRCAVDIRTIDVAAASREGILVTQASAGFGPAVAEWVIGTMIDLSRRISTKSKITKKGFMAVTTCSILSFATALPTNRTAPTGGVIRPIPRLTIMIMPK